MSETIDICFDFRSDTPPGLDADTFSPTLRTYHQLLWSKPLPSGAPFDLAAATPPYYLHHASHLGEFWLSSDAVVPTFSRAPELADIIAQIPQEDGDEFNRLGYTIGGMMIFPANRIGRRMTINGARGFHPRIRDRFDLSSSVFVGITLARPTHSVRRLPGTQTSSVCSTTSLGM